MHDPKIIFLDEPTNAMDLVNARKLRGFIKEQGRGGKRTIILTSHNMSDIEDVCERIVIINRGRIVFDGGIDALHRIAGFWKRIRVAFDGPCNIDDVQKLGRIKEMNDQELILEVEPDKTASVASRLFDAFPVKDISITGPGLEEIIESIYLQNSD